MYGNLNNGAVKWKDYKQWVAQLVDHSTNFTQITPLNQQKNLPIFKQACNTSVPLGCTEKFLPVGKLFQKVLRTSRCHF